MRSASAYMQCTTASAGWALRLRTRVAEVVQPHNDQGGRPRGTLAAGQLNAQDDLTRLPDPCTAQDLAGRGAARSVEGPELLAPEPLPPSAFGCSGATDASLACALYSLLYNVSANAMWTLAEHDCHELLAARRHSSCAGDIAEPRIKHLDAQALQHVLNAAGDEPHAVHHGGLAQRLHVPC